MIFGLDFKKGLGALITWTIIMILIICLCIFAFRVFGYALDPEVFSVSLKAIPDVVKDALYISVDTDMSQIYNFIAYCYQFIILISCIYAAVMGANALAKDESNGVIEFIYSLPVARKSIVQQKTFCGMFRYLLYSTVIYFFTCGAIAFLNSSIQFTDIVTTLIDCYVSMITTGFLFMAVGRLFSSLFRNAGEAIAVTIAFMLITFIIGMTANTFPELEFLVYLSPIHALLPLAMMISGFATIPFLANIALIFTCVILTQIRYKKKDFIL